MDSINEMILEIIKNLESLKQIKDNRRTSFIIRHANYYCLTKENAKTINLFYYKSFEKLLKLLGEHFAVSRETLDYWFKEAREDEEV